MNPNTKYIFTLALPLLCLTTSLLIAGDAEFDSATLTGSVTDSQGKPMPGVAVMSNKLQGAKLESFPDTVTTDKNGKYELKFRFKKGKTLTVREVFADKKGFVRDWRDVDIQLDGGDNRELNFQLQRGEKFVGMLNVPLHDSEKSPPEKARKTIAKRLMMLSGPAIEELSVNGRVYQTDSEGRFELRLPRGSYSIKLLAYWDDSVEWHNLETGQANLTLELPVFEWNEAAVGKVFDRFWAAINNQYSYFFLKKGLDWNEEKIRFRPQAIRCKNRNELATVLQNMLSRLKDAHVWIDVDGEILGTHKTEWHFNGDSRFTVEQIVNRTVCGKFAIVGESKQDGFGYFLMTRQSAANAANVKQAVDAIRRLDAAPGFVIDLRRANGGNENLAREIAKLFCNKDRVYALSKYRVSAKHDEFSEPHERILPATASAYTKPVVCLIGPGAVSSGEGFAKMMSCLPNVTTVGAATRGSSGNPRPIQLSTTGIKVYFSRWVDMMPDGQVIEGTGVAPAIAVDHTPTADASDPVLRRGLEVLREEIEVYDAAP